MPVLPAPGNTQSADELLPAASAQPPATIRVRSAAARLGRREAVEAERRGAAELEQLDAVEPEQLFWDSEGNPIEEEWRTNGSMMHEPPIRAPPPRARATLISMTPWVEPLAGPSFLGLPAAGSGAGSPMSLAGAFRDMLTREPAAATFITDGSERGLEEVGL